MPKGAIEDTRSATAVVKLRQMIRELEIGAADLVGRRERVLDMLRLRDQVEQEMSRLQEGGLDLRPENTRTETVDNIFYRKAPIISRELRHVGGLSGARRAEQPLEEHWWWYLDQYWAERQRKRAIKSASIIVGVLVLIIAGNYVMTRFFGLSPLEREARGYVGQAEQFLRSGDTQKAIAEYEKAVAVLPTEGDTRATLGVLYELQGREDEAQEAFIAAEEAFGDRAEFLTSVARVYQNVGEPDLALAKIQEAVALAPESAQALLIRGGIYEALEKQAEALQDYELSAELARKAGEDALYVLARTRMAMLLQRAPAMTGPGGGF